MGKGKELLPVDLPPSIHNKTGVLQDVLQSSAVNGDSLASYEQAAIHNALQKCSGNRQEAAKLLGIGAATLYRKLKLYNED
jgi:two-component system response regulator HydG